MAQDTQYCNLRYILGTAYSGKTEASEISPRYCRDPINAALLVQSYSLSRIINMECDLRIAALSTMFLIVNLFIALSLGVHLEQFEHRMGLTCPRPFLLRPLMTWCQLTIFWGTAIILRRSLLDHLSGFYLMRNWL